MHPPPTVMADRTGKKNYWCTVSGLHCLLTKGTLVRQYIGILMSPAPLLNWWTDGFISPIEGQKKKKKKKRTKQFGAPYLFSSQLPIN
jgi:hypothetical protein